MHLVWNSEHGFQFDKLSVEWKKLFTEIGITKEELEDPKTAKLLLKTLRKFEKENEEKEKDSNDYSLMGSESLLRLLNGEGNMDRNKLEELEEEASCSVCLEVFSEPMTLACKHDFCKQCIDLILETQDNETISCPLCRTECSKDTITFNQSLAELSAKVKKLLDHPTIGVKQSKNENYVITYCKEDQPFFVPSHDQCLGNCDDDTGESFMFHVLDNVESDLFPLLRKDERIKHIMQSTETFITIPEENSPNVYITIEATDQKNIETAIVLLREVVKENELFAQKPPQEKNTDFQEILSQIPITDIPRLKDSIEQIEKATNTNFRVEDGVLVIHGNNATNVSSSSEMIRILHQDIQ